MDAPAAPESPGPIYRDGTGPAGSRRPHAPAAAAGRQGPGVVVLRCSLSLPFSSCVCVGGGCKHSVATDSDGAIVARPKFVIGANPSHPDRPSRSNRGPALLTDRVCGDRQQPMGTIRVDRDRNSSHSQRRASRGRAARQDGGARSRRPRRPVGAAGAGAKVATRAAAGRQWWQRQRWKEELVVAAAAGHGGGGRSRVGTMVPDAQ